MTDEKVLAASNFDHNPPVAHNQYDDSIRLFTAAYEPLFDMAHASLRSIAGETAGILIVGAGTGMEICTFGQKSSGWHFTGVDPSAEMLAISGKKIAEKGLSERVELVNGYCDDLPESCLYDGATCILVMHFLPDDGSKLRLLQSISRHLKRGAPLILVDDTGEPKSEEFWRTVDAWRTYVKTKGADPKLVDEGFSGQILKRLHFVPEGRIYELLDQAGFEKPSRFFTAFLYCGWVAVKN
ncbi:class I SAM-dependent methyltransferase [Methanocella arvoryzae]|uniref:Predicted SAM-dependent methyltransferase n=1 Tax=Methanocella arvoryzae (strain DSM 22066 / NBRC 105507 / MRE50) TaxID=351160 RepID=Q0W2U5_METAR|nr:class I SAM-dependent methyltransferase [Methanocella arvoryzae]CAJ37298.1 predicted SAM-dependent methyltransferase [Methanocella arvoryzae MRE50]